jgi:hypothetical protein
MPPQIADNKRALWDDSETSRANVVEHGGDETACHTAAPHRPVDLGMHECHDIPVDRVVEHAEELAFAPDLVARLVPIVLDDVLRLRHDDVLHPVLSLRLAPGDFPFLAQIRGHDDDRLAEYAKAVMAAAPWPG